MANRKRVLRVVVVVGIVGLVAVGIAATIKLRQQREVATETADAIRTTLDDLDPATRAMVREQLAKDAIDEVRDSS
jgi:hypothetical protein